MRLPDKPAYPTDLVSRDGGGTELDLSYKEHTGLTFRERLIVALAGSALTRVGSPDKDAEIIIAHADAIIKQLEGEQK